MAPVQVTKDPESSKITITFNSWMIPVIILVLTVLSNFVLGSIRTDDKTIEQVNNQGKEIAELKESRKTAGQVFVYRGEYNIDIKRIDDKLKNIDNNVTMLVERQVRGKQ